MRSFCGLQLRWRFGTTEFSLPPSSTFRRFSCSCLDTPASQAWAFSSAPCHSFGSWLECAGESTVVHTSSAITSRSSLVPTQEPLPRFMSLLAVRPVTFYRKSSLVPKPVRSISTFTTTLLCFVRPVATRPFMMRLLNPTWPNHALQRTAPCVTAPASAAALPPTMQVPRRTPRSLSLGSLAADRRSV